MHSFKKKNVEQKEKKSTSIEVFCSPFQIMCTEHIDKCLLSV